MGSQVLTMTFDAETQKFVSNVLKAKDALEATAKTGTDMGDKIAAAGDKALKATEKMKLGSETAGVSVASLASNWLSMGAAVSAAAALWNEHLEKMKAKADALRQSNDSLVKSLAPSGQTSELPQVRAQLGTIQSTLFAPQDVRDIYGKITERGGREFTTEEKLAATRQAVRAGAAGHEDTGGFGADFLQIQKQMKAGGVNLKENEIGSLVAQLQKSKAGGLDEQDIRLLGHDNDKFRALDLIAARGRSREAAKQVNALESEALEDPSAELLEKARKHKHKLTDEDKRKLRLGEIAPGDRIGAILNDPSLVPERQRLLVSNLARNLHAGEFREAASGNALGNEIGDVQQLRREDAKTEAAYRAREIEVRGKTVLERNNFKALNDQNFRENRSVENAEATGRDPGTVADIQATIGKLKDSLLLGPVVDLLKEIAELNKKGNGHLEDIKSKTPTTNSRIAPHPLEDR